MAVGGHEAEARVPGGVVLVDVGVPRVHAPPRVVVEHVRAERLDVGDGRGLADRGGEPRRLLVLGHVEAALLQRVPHRLDAGDEVVRVAGLVAPRAFGLPELGRTEVEADGVGMAGYAVDDLAETGVEQQAEVGRVAVRDARAEQRQRRREPNTVDRCPRRGRPPPRSPGRTRRRGPCGSARSA